jgi:hypothetical protein
VALDPVGEAVPLLGRVLPRGERVAVLGEARPVIEVLEVGEAHLGVGGVRVRGIERPDPAVLALGGALHHRLEQLAGRGASPRLALRLDLRELASVGLCPDRDPAVRVLGRPP